VTSPTFLRFEQTLKLEKGKLRRSFVTNVKRSTAMNKTFNELGTYPTAGQKVQIVRLESTQGMLIKAHHLTVRRLGQGIAKSYVPGHGGDVWFVDHGDGNTGAYSVSEMAPVT
jgi:hypothetical protein